MVGSDSRYIVILLCSYLMVLWMVYSDYTSHFVQLRQGYGHGYVYVYGYGYVQLNGTYSKSLGNVQVQGRSYRLENQQWTFSVKPQRVNGTDGELVSERDKTPLWDVDRYVNRNSSHLRCGKHLLIIMVESAPAHVDQRKLIRKTWGQVRENPPDKSEDNRLRTLFVVGKSNATNINDLVVKESLVHQDIVIGNFSDVYHNLTIKSIFGIQSIYKKCKFSYLFKTDDDCFVNTELLLANIEQVEGSRHVYIGRTGDPNPSRDPYSKWFISEHDYPFQQLAPFNLGGGYLLSIDTVLVLLRQYKYTPFIVNEDVYVGYVLSRSNIKACTIKGFFDYEVDFNNVCSLNSVFSVHNRTHYSSSQTIELNVKSYFAIYSKGRQCKFSNDIIKQVIHGGCHNNTNV